MKQGTPQRSKMGRIAMIMAAIAGVFGRNKTDRSLPDLMKHKNDLLLNRYSGPAPRRVLNQRQKRKRARQNNNYKR